MVKISQYEPKYSQEWDRFVESSRTPLFFFKRAFLEYHKERFEDYSLIAFDQDLKILALLPATRHGDRLVSHGGLTYGGLLVAARTRSGLVGEVLSEMLEYIQNNGIRSLDYKAVPHIFHVQPAQDDLYFLFNKHSAKLVRRDLSSVVDIASRLKPSKGRRALIARARKLMLHVTESTDFEGFHKLLSSVLERHGVSPVHSVEELALLHSKFPDNLKLRLVYQEGELLAGCLLFIFPKVVHTQYLAVSDKGKDVGALDLLIEQLIEKASTEYNGQFFSFGISTEQKGRYLNEGLLAQKEGFGGRAMAIDTMRVKLS